jgi:hypothetical protein
MCGHLIMRAFAIVLVLLGACAADRASRAEQANDCKLCRDQQRACAKNHSSAACNTEYEICMRHCRRT